MRVVIYRYLNSLLKIFQMSSELCRSDLTKSISRKSQFLNYSCPYGRFFVITYCRCKVHSHLNSKMEILTIFSIFNSLFLPKMEIFTLFSSLNSLFLLKLEIFSFFFIFNSLFLPKMEILTVFSIFNSLFLLKMEILTVFSILNML